MITASLLAFALLASPPAGKPWQKYEAVRGGAVQPNYFDQFDRPIKASGTVAKSAIIPVPFRGEWNEELRDCGTARNETRLRIGARDLRFYESDGEVKRVTVHTGRAITVRATFAGEGQVWDADQTLVLSRSGNDLTVTKEGSSFTRHRCPANVKRK